MKKTLTYSVVIYLICTMMILLQKPNFLYENGKIKSWNYFKNKIRNFNDPNELISLPIIFMAIGLFSYIIAKNI
jgi:hypothetical protein